MDAGSDDDFRPFANECIWYYLVIVAVVIIIGWCLILVGCFGKECDPCIPKEARPWPTNLYGWHYSPANVIIYLIWTGVLLLYFWASNHVTCLEPVTDQQRNLFRAIYTAIMLFLLADFFLFFVVHNVMAALISNIFALILTLGVIGLYTSVDIDDAWYTVPLLLWICYRIYALLFIIYNNPPHVTMHYADVVL
jgi:hypothetical protein